MSSEVVVIGGGPGGVSCALYLIRLGIEVTLVSGNIGGKQNHYQTIHGLAPHRSIKAGEYVAELKEAVALAQRDASTNFRLRSGMVTKVERDRTERFHVHTDDGDTIQAKYLVVASGSSTDLSAIPSSIKAGALTFEDFPFDGIGTSKRVLVLGAGYSAAEMVRTLKAKGHTVLVMDLDPSSFERLPTERRRAFHDGNCTLVFDKYYRLSNGRVDFMHKDGPDHFVFDHVLACTGEKVNTSFLPKTLLNARNHRMTIIRDPKAPEVCMSDKWQRLYAIGDIRDEELTSFIACAQADGIRVAQGIQRRIMNGD